MSDEPATGSPGGPASWRREREAPVEGAADWREDARWSFLYGADTSYAAEHADPGAVAAAGRRMREQAPTAVQGPLIRSPVWTWEVPLYFWFGGIAAGASFAALGCDLAGDRRSAATARKVALAAVAPAPALLIADLGRPARFLNMLRIFKPGSPMNLGAWALVAFSTLAGASVAADLRGRPSAARSAGAAGALVGAYLGSYTGALLAATAVPVWARSRLLLGPIFVTSATATGAAATRLALAGLPPGHSTRVALGRVESAAIVAELALSRLNERRLGPLAGSLVERRPGRMLKLAKVGAAAALALRLAPGLEMPVARHAPSALFLASGLALRYGWLEAGRASARDDEAVARTAREAPLRRPPSVPPRRPRDSRLARGYAEVVRRASLAIEARTPAGGSRS